jgi:predicted transcriptional regulator
LKYLARPLRSDESAANVELASNTIIREATPKIMEAHHPIHVIENGKSIGVVSAEDILGLIAGVN